MKQKLKKNKGITLVALVITIIVIIILAGISINLLLGNSGIINKAKKGQVIFDVATAQERLELVKTEIPIKILDNKDGTVNLENYLEELNKDKNKENCSVTSIEKINETNAEILVSGKYKFLAHDTEKGNVEITYLGEAGGLQISLLEQIYTYPISGTFEVTSNESEGKLTVKSENENIAKASISGNIVTVEPQNMAGQANIIVTSSANGKYAEGRVTHKATVENGEIILEAEVYIGNYDGTAHDAIKSVTVDPEDALVEYALGDGEYSSEIPKVTGASEYTVSIKASKAGYAEKEITKTVTVGQKNVSNLTITLGEIEYTYDGTAKEPTVTVKDGSKTLVSGTDYTVTYSNNVNVGIATATITGKGNYTGIKTVDYTIIEAIASLAEKVNIGDYVAYDATNNYSYTSPKGTGMSHGNGYENQKFTTNSNIKWRVLSKNTTTGEVVLISKLPIQTDAGADFYMNGPIGYLYAEQEVNEICKIYGHGVGANTSKTFTYQTGDVVEGLTTGKITGSGARSINADDINKITGYVPSTSTKSYTRTVYYPTTKTSTGKSTTAVSRTYEHNYYNYTLSSYLNKSELYYEMLFMDVENNKYSNYWVSWRYIIYEGGDTFMFLAGVVENNNFYGAGFTEAISVGMNDIYCKSGVRPIVYLKPTLKTNGKDSSGAWVIIDQ